VVEKGKYGLGEDEWELLVGKFGEAPLEKILKKLAESKLVRNSLDRRIGRPYNFVALEGGPGENTKAVYVDESEAVLLIRAAKAKEVELEKKGRGISGSYRR